MFKKFKQYITAYKIAQDLQPNIFYKIFDVIIRLLSLTLFPFLYLFLALFFPNVRFGFLYNRRIGHLAHNTELFLRRRDLGLVDETKKYIFFSYKPANNQLLRMFKRNIFIIESEWITKLFSPFGFFETKFKCPLPFIANEHHEFHNAKSTLKFTDVEQQIGLERLRQFGLKDDDWYVCIFARDNAYTDLVFPKLDHSSMNHRNSDINSYIPAVKLILERGGFVFRMGYTAEKPFGLEHPRIIDYALTSRTDFMDIYLPAHCKFYLGTSNGTADLARIFDKPHAAVNWMPIGTAPFGKNEIYIPKVIIDKADESPIPFSMQIEILGNLSVNFFDDPIILLPRLNLALRNNTPDEIYDLTLEMLNRLDGNYSQSSLYMEKFIKYRNVLIKSNHWCSGVENQIGDKFLMSMKI